MKASLLLSIITAIAISANAQNTGTANQPNGTKQPADQLGKPSQLGQPGQMGQPGQPGPNGQMGQPGQPGPNGQMGQPGQPGPNGQMGQPGQPGPNGQMGQPGQPGPNGQMGQPGQKGPGENWTPAKCEKQIPNLKKGAENCLRVKAEAARKTCFDKIGNSFPQGFFEACRAQVEPIKAEVEAKEKEKYPNQQSALPKGDDKSQQGNKDPEANKAPAKKVDCTKVLAEIRKAADSCIKTKDQAKRKSCFDKVGEKVQSSGAEQSCGDALNAIKTEFQAKESKMYPGQPASIQ